jgi:hypothetical protein
MRKKLNCWEYKKCGREPGGAKVSELGVCPSTTETGVDGVNSGKNGGRVCWVVAGTFCRGKVQGTLAQKLSSCLTCDFYKLVADEEEEKFVVVKDILARLRK